jgi:hypothetical protein
MSATRKASSCIPHSLLEATPKLAQTQQFDRRQQLLDFTKIHSLSANLEHLQRLILVQQRELLSSVPANFII